MAEPETEFERLLASDEEIGVVARFESDHYAVVDWNAFCDWLGRLEDAHNDEVDDARKASEREVMRKALERLMEGDE